MHRVRPLPGCATPEHPKPLLPEAAHHGPATTWNPPPTCRSSSRRKARKSRTARYCLTRACRHSHSRSRLRPVSVGREAGRTFPQALLRGRLRRDYGTARTVRLPASSSAPSTSSTSLHHSICAATRSSWRARSPRAGPRVPRHGIRRAPTTRPPASAWTGREEAGLRHPVVGEDIEDASQVAA